MDTILIIGIVVIAVLAVLAIAGAVAYRAVPYLQSRRLKGKFGPEYTRALKEHESKLDAEKELRERQKRHRELRLREIPGEQRQAYAAEWARIQERFVDAPEGSAHDAYALVNRIIADRGYDAADHERRLADLSVEHPRSVDHFRQAHEITARAERHEATTDELRSAVVHYRALVTDLLNLDGTPTAETPRAEDPSRAEGTTDRSEVPARKMPWRRPFRAADR